MRAEDLRIGNLVMSEVWNNYSDIQGIEKCESWYQLRINGWIHRIDEDGYTEIKPIPLTGEWILKLGGQRNELNNEYWISVFNLKGELHFETFNSTDEVVTTLYSRSCQLIFDRIKYVHQLQNLYFALTGSELTIKP